MTKVSNDETIFLDSAQICAALVRGHIKNDTKVIFC